MTGDESLFPDFVAPVRKGSADYLSVLAGEYEGHALWDLAPIDRGVMRRYGVEPMSSDFVWLIADGQPVWALIDTRERRIVVLDPEPTDKSLREEPYWAGQRAQRRCRLRRLYGTP